jgi:hypothetical protein
MKSLKIDLFHINHLKAKLSVQPRDRLNNYQANFSYQGKQNSANSDQFIYADKIRTIAV